MSDSSSKQPAEIDEPMINWGILEMDGLPQHMKGLEGIKRVFFDQRDVSVHQRGDQLVHSAYRAVNEAGEEMHLSEKQVSSIHWLICNAHGRPDMVKNSIFGVRGKFSKSVLAMMDFEKKGGSASEDDESTGIAPEPESGADKQSLTLLQTVDAFAAIAKANGLDPQKTKFGDTVLLLGEKNPEVMKVNAALTAMKNEDKIGFFKQLHALLRRAGKNKLELEELIGKLEDPNMGMRLMFTLTETGTELRCWHGAPGRGMSDHIDSAGGGLVFNVCESRQWVKQYVDAIIDKEDYCALRGPNGATYWVRW